MSFSLSEMIRLVSNTKEAARKGIDMSTIASWCHADLGINCNNYCFPIFFFRYKALTSHMGTYYMRSAYKDRLKLGNHDACHNKELL